jgi:hypothetical protein
MPCAESRQDFEASDREYREIVFSVLKDFPKVRIFDAAAIMCDAQWCWAMKDGKLLYGDSNHISAEGSRYISKVLVKLLRTEIM